MPAATYTSLEQFLTDHTEQPDIKALHDEFIRLTAVRPDMYGTDELFSLYERSLALMGDALGAMDYAADAVQECHRACQELEALIRARGNDNRHSFVIIIPVADRPLHLRACLDSLLEQCRAFDYGGQCNGRYLKVMALIADDSKDSTNIDRHRDIAAHFSTCGLETLYFGLDEQVAQLEKLPDSSRKQLARIIGTADKSAFYHKGPSILRNIVYLKLHELFAGDRKRLFYFIDSDQEFKVRVSRKSGDADIVLINYFQQLDRLFTENDISVLTGKVVGDPPVSPAVMAGTFLDDVIGFLDQIATLQHDAACRFHAQTPRLDAGASYHDMAGLFGFDKDTQPYEYRCNLAGEHNHAHCLTDFSDKLQRFFDGVHPTRITYFDNTAKLTETQPARTVYTGNYVLRSDALRNFIPFATLRLRMAGPTLGRLIRLELGPGFVSANLPLLHKRTVNETGQSEYRPGVDRSTQTVDLTGEFERQYFGDIMLFSINKLVADGYPHTDVSADRLDAILTATAAEIQQQYKQQHTEILSKLDTLSRLIENQDVWANYPATSKDRFKAFLDTMTHNFGRHSENYRRVQAPDIQANYRQNIREAISQYMDDKTAWDNALNRSSNAI